MKVIFVVAALVACALAAPSPQQSDKDAVVVKSEFDNIGVEGYKFGFETSNGISRSETAEVRNVGSENESIAVRGTISWVAADGTPYHLEFVADENGFQPVGDHIPK